MAWTNSDILEGIVIGVAGGIVGASLKEAAQYAMGWWEVRRNRGADFHVAGTMFPKIDPADSSHARYLPALEKGKTHVQELVWLGREIPLHQFASNHYMFREIVRAMAKAEGPGLLLGEFSERAERLLLKKLTGYHNSIPDNDIVRIYKKHVGASSSGRVSGISPPTHEHYSGSQHRRVLRAMFIADSQLKGGIPEKSKIHFHKDTHEGRYNTLMVLIDKYKEDPERFRNCFVYF